MNLVENLYEVITDVEGFNLTLEDCKKRKIPHPTLAQKNNNPGNIRNWSHHGVILPKVNGYVYFSSVDEGRNALKSLIQQYIDGKYHNGKSPTLAQFFEKYAPSSDGNYPKIYASIVAKKLSIPTDVPLKEIQNAGGLVSSG